MIEAISIKGEDFKPKLDSVQGNNVYVSYRYTSSLYKTGEKFEIPFVNAVLGEGLFREGTLKFNYFFSGIYVQSM